MPDKNYIFVPCYKSVTGINQSHSTFEDVWSELFRELPTVPQLSSGETGIQTQVWFQMPMMTFLGSAFHVHDFIQLKNLLGDRPGGKVSTDNQLRIPRNFGDWNI